MKQKFISDILLVDADLFNKLLQSDSAVQEELKQFLTEYIHNYKLPDQLLRSRPWVRDGSCSHGSWKQPDCWYVWVLGALRGWEDCTLATEKWNNKQAKVCGSFISR